MRAFDSRSACREYLRQELELQGPENVTEGLLAGLVRACEAPESGSEPPGQELPVILGRWVIRDEDLALFASLKDATLSLAAVQYVFQDLNAAGLAALFFAVAQLCLNAYRTGALVSRRRCRSCSP